MKRLETDYTHVSRVFKTADGANMTMTWASSCGFENWDFVCLDDTQQPVARFRADIWAVKKFALIEFLGEGDLTDTVSDEIVVTGTTLYMCIVLRVNNPMQLVGAMLYNPPKVVKSDSKNVQDGGRETKLDEWDAVTDSVTAKKNA
ncbi:hypothetical protein BJ878DRAFT_571445 [Calycina marina]|uniref:Uncharacterized protein n=1 Tax=Calycina marina TaxID=1763456 RepID=A0A9P7YVN0_9HELO|nr:hypothetical protein BJ878DRAFT_571445 [Calycina marina]